MGELGDAINRRVKHKGPRCTIGALRMELSEDERRDLDAALQTEWVASTAISAGIAEVYKRRIAGTQIARHRRGDCLCAIRLMSVAKGDPRWDGC